jgi:hypothetical protein
VAAMEDVLDLYAEPYDPGYPVVLDNLNTHSPASLYAAFPAPEARRLVRKLEFHHTPSMAPGSTLPNASSPCWSPNASIDACPTWQPWRARWRHGRSDAIGIARPSADTSPPPRAAASSAISLPPPGMINVVAHLVHEPGSRRDVDRCPLRAITPASISACP